MGGSCLSSGTSEIDAAISIAQARGIGSRRVARLFEEFGSYRAIASSSPGELAHVLRCSSANAARIVRSISQAKATRLRMVGQQHGAVAIPRGDVGYPMLLEGICDPPPLIWARGNLSLLNRPGVAVIGTRRCSADAADVIDQFVGPLGRAGFVIISGGARGVDAAAHRAALREGVETIAVLGSGLDQPYPPEHVNLFEEIVTSNGLIITEYACGVGPRPGQFPARNRIVAGMCIGVLVHQAGARSGAMITARLAAEENGREVMVVPGSILDQRNRGAHRAIREGWAALVDAPEEALEVLMESRGLIQALEEGSPGELD